MHSQQNINSFIHERIKIFETVEINHQKNVTLLKWYYLQKMLLNVTVNEQDLPVSLCIKCICLF
jgi:hypothetical protein